MLVEGVADRANRRGIELAAEVHAENVAALPDLLMGMLTDLKADAAYPVDRCEHSLQAATRALREAGAITSNIREAGSEPAEELVREAVLACDTDEVVRIHGNAVTADAAAGRALPGSSLIRASHH